MKIWENPLNKSARTCFLAGTDVLTSRHQALGRSKDVPSSGTDVLFRRVARSTDVLSRARTCPSGTQSQKLYENLQMLSTGVLSDGHARACMSMDEHGRICEPRQGSGAFRTILKHNQNSGNYPKKHQSGKYRAKTTK